MKCFIERYEIQIKKDDLFIKYDGSNVIINQKDFGFEISTSSFIDLTNFYIAAFSVGDNMNRLSYKIKVFDCVIREQVLMAKTVPFLPFGFPGTYDDSNLKFYAINIEV